jgi:LuxR family maltose regulon positive regulatory protein
MMAPAGSGKTSLAITYIQTLERPVAWYSLGSGDHDPAVFLRYLVAAFAKIEPAIEQQLTPLVAAHWRGDDQAPAIVDALNAALPPATLVLDDLHILERNGTYDPRIESVLNALLRHCPQLQIILSSRDMPPLDGIVTLLAHGEALIVNGPTLDFTSKEIEQLWEQTLGAPNAAERDQLLATSSGWATAVGLALTARSASMPRNIDDRDVLYAYLANEVLHQLPDNLREFVLDTALLEYLDTERCNQLRRSDDSARHIDALKQRSLFVETTDEGTLRYQPLFRNFLLHQLRRQSERHATLLRAALELAKEEGRYDWLWNLATEAQAWDAAANLLETAGPHLRHSGQHATLLSWLDRLPTHALTPALWRLKAQILTDQGQLNEAQVALDWAARGTNEDRMMAQVLRAQILQQQGQFDPAAELIAPYLDNEQLPAEWRARVLRLDGILHARSGTYEAARQRLQQALALLQNEGDLFDIARLNQN